MVLDNVLSIVNEVLSGADKPQLKFLSKDTRLREDIGFSSFDLAELTVRIEEEFGVDIFATGLVNTIGEVVVKIEESNNG